MDNSEIIQTILKIIAPENIYFSTSDGLKSYIFRKATELTQLVKPFFNIGGTGYTLFFPMDMSFRGEWAPYSPSFFWGLNNIEKEKAILSAYLYYLWPEEVPAYTELWLGDLSSYLPWNIQLITHEKVKEDFEIELRKEESLINIHFSKEIWQKLDSFLENSIQILTQTFGCQNWTERDYLLKRQNFDDGTMQFDFRSVDASLKYKSYSKFNLSLYDINKITGALYKTLYEVLYPYFPKDFNFKIEQLSKVLIKLLMLGPSCCIALRILNPKQFRSQKDILDYYIGNYAGLLRVYDKNMKFQELEETLKTLYLLTSSLICNIGFRVSTHFIDKFRAEHALRSAIAAIIARNLSHNPGSHVLAHILGNTMHLGTDEQNNFLEYLKARMDFIAEITTYWREISWLEQLI